MELGTCFYSSILVISVGWLGNEYVMIGGQYWGTISETGVQTNQFLILMLEYFNKSDGLLKLNYIRIM